MGSLTTIFYSVGGTLCILTSLFLFVNYFKNKSSAALSLAFVPFWIGIHAYAYIFPLFIDPNDMKLLGFGYIVGSATIFLVQLFGLEVQLFMTKQETNPRFIWGGTILITLAACVTLLIMIYDFRTPIVNESGIILWNVNKISQWLIGLSGLIYGLVWGYVFYHAAIVVNDLQSRFRLIVMSIVGVLIGMVAFLVHTSSTEIQTLLGHILFVISGIMILTVFVIPKRFFPLK